MKYLYHLLILLLFVVSCTTSDKSAQNVQSSDLLQDTSESSNQSFRWKLDSVIETNLDAEGVILAKEKWIHIWDLATFRDTMVVTYDWKQNTNEGQNWKLLRTTRKYHDAENAIDSLVNRYEQYDEVTGQFSLKKEYRTNTIVKDVNTISKPLDKDWSRASHQLSIHDSVNYVKTYASYNRTAGSAKYELVKKEETSYDQEGRLEGKKHIRSSGQFSEVRREFVYEGNGRMVSQSKTNTNELAPNWIDQYRETEEFDEQKRLIKKSKEIWNAEKKYWYTQVASEIVYDSKTGKVKSKSYFEDIDGAKYVCTSKNIYTYNSRGFVEKQESFDYDYEKSMLKPNFNKTYEYNKIDSIRTTLQENFDNGAYDLMKYEFGYDGEGRVLKESYRVKNKDMDEWRFVSDNTYEYHFENNTNYTKKSTYNKKDSIFEERTFQFDNKNNLIQNDYFYGKSKSKSTYKYYDNIEVDQTLIPASYGRGYLASIKKWPLHNTTQTRERYRYEKGKWYAYQIENYFFSEIE